MKTCGLDTVASYIFWNHHEFIEGVYNFTGNNDIHRFIELCGKHGLYFIMRIGPYCHGEARNGGIPDWMFGQPYMIRSNDAGYLTAVERYFNELGKQVQGLMFSDGGPVIAIQLENEYMASCSPWEITVGHSREWTTTGESGLPHMVKLRELAHTAGMVTPFITVTGWGNAPYVEGEMLPLYGGYAYTPWIYWEDESAVHPPGWDYIFHDSHNGDIPYACCEIGGGMQNWYPHRFTVDPVSVEAMAAVRIANGCNMLGYYMFHGGSNPVINNVYQNEQLCPRISYDFEATLGEFGQVRESYRRIKLLHYFLKETTNFISRSASVIQSEEILPEDMQTLRYAARSDGEAGYLFLSNYQDHLQQTDKKISLTIQTKESDIPFALTVTRDVFVILPFNQSYDGIKIKSATVQYITRIAHDDEVCHFFFAHNSMAREIHFADEISITSITNAEIINTDGSTIIKLPEAAITSFTVQGKKNVRFICLNREMSLNFWRVQVGGTDYAIITPANVYTDETNIYFESIEMESYNIMSFPALPHENENRIKQIATDTGTPIGFPTYRVSGLTTILPFAIENSYPNRCLLNFDMNSFSSFSEIYMDITYTGDVGRAFINGILVHDNFYNGAPWQIGLKTHTEALKNNKLCLIVSPVKNNKNINVEATATYAAITLEHGESVINKIRLLPETTIKL
jgi:hypothetical protein